MKRGSRWILPALVVTVLLVAVFVPLSRAQVAGLSSNGVIVGSSYHNDTSPPLRDIKQSPIASRGEREANENPKLPSNHKDSPDGAIQGPDLAAPAPNIPATTLNFDGIPFPGVGCNCAPPDTDGEVGLTQYVQIVNEGYQVFDKTTGASVLGPSGISTIWSGFGGVCQSNGSGDPVVLYDQLANRWIISQFAGVSVPTDECVAVSTTSDATGSYNRYGFHLGSNFFDYPKLSVWPDAYYMSMNVFNSSGTAFLGPQPFAFDRAKMLAGLPATFVSTGVTGGSGEDSYLPADLDGSTLPAAGAPASFVEWPGTGAYRVFHFHADFAVPANSTFTLFSSPAAAGFTALCPATRSCVPQVGTTSRVDGIGDRLMHRLAYRNFGSFESVVGNFSVSAGGVSGIRWFELRNVTAGPVTVFQESTYQPDATWRWMGSAAQDKQGNLAVGFSASSSTINPQIRYAGRLAGDPVNTLAQGEAHLFDGTGSQTGTSSRWGDYSAMTVDPVDDCTFWYTQEYYTTTTSFNWRTRIGNFKFAQCSGTSSTPTPTSTPTGTPTNTPSRTPTPTLTNTPTNTPTRTATNTPTLTPTNTPTLVPTTTPTNTPTNAPTNAPTLTPTNTPTPVPTTTPTNTPTSAATNTPTPTPTSTPTSVPTTTPTNTPTNAPTNTPTNTRTNTPTNVATSTPTSTPTNTPTPGPATGKIGDSLTTCSTFSSGSLTLVNTITYKANPAKIKSVSPAGFSYFSRVAGPFAANDVITITQTDNSANGTPLFAAQSPVSLFSPTNCSASAANVTIATGNPVTITFIDPFPGDLIIGVKYSTAAVVNAAPPSPATVHYSFATAKGVVVDHNTNGLDLSP